MELHMSDDVLNKIIAVKIQYIKWKMIIRQEGAAISKSFFCIEESGFKRKQKHFFPPQRMLRGRFFVQQISWIEVIPMHSGYQDDEKNLFNLNE